MNKPNKGREKIRKALHHLFQEHQKDKESSITAPKEISNKESKDQNRYYIRRGTELRSLTD